MSTQAGRSSVGSGKGSTAFFTVATWIRRRPRLAVGLVSMAVALPYCFGVYGPVESEVFYWGVVILAVGAGLAALSRDPMAVRKPWYPAVFLIALSMLAFALHATSVLAPEHWSPIFLPPFVMLLITLITLFGRSRLAVATSRILVAVLAVLIAAAQFPAVWAWFFVGQLSDRPGATPFTTPWAHSMPHLLLAGLALWLAIDEVAKIRGIVTDPPLDV